MRESRSPNANRKHPWAHEFGLIIKTKRHHYSIMSARQKEGPSRVLAKNRNRGQTHSIEHQRIRSTHREDTTTCAGRNRAPSVTTFISPLLCQTCDGVDKEEKVIRKHTREPFLALSIEAAALGVTYWSDVNNCYRNLEGNQ